MEDKQRTILVVGSAQEIPVAEIALRTRSIVRVLPFIAFAEAMAVTPNCGDATFIAKPHFGGGYKHRKIVKRKLTKAQIKKIKSKRRTIKKSRKTNR